MYWLFLRIVAFLFGLKVETIKLRKPIGAVYWPYSETKNVVYQIYVSNHKKGVSKPSFGFWEINESLLEANKKAFKKALLFLKH